MSFVIARITLPVLLGGLLGLQIVHFYVDWVRYHVPIYSGTFAFQEEDKLFLPTRAEMKRLAIQLGAQEGIGLIDRNVDVGVVQDVLRVTVRSEDRADWGRFFARYDRELSLATASHWTQGAPTGSCTCQSPGAILFKGWSGGRESWIKPLDLVSLTVLTVAFVGSFTRREAAWKR